MRTDLDAGPRAGTLSLRGVARRERGSLALTYGLLAIEQAFGASQPWLFGLAIDGLARGERAPLALLAFVALLCIGVGGVRRYFDTRCFARLSSELGRETARRLARQGEAPASVIARTALIDEYVDFFERFLPAAAQAVASALFGVVALALLEPRVALACGAILTPLVLVHAWYARRSYALSGRLHDALERRVEVLGASRASAVRGAFERLRRVRVALSDAEAACFTAIELVSLAAGLWAVVVLASAPGATPGGVFAGLTYVAMVLGAVEIAPLVLHQMAKLREIGVRL